MEEIDYIDPQEEDYVDDFKERRKIRNKRHNYTIKEVQTILRSFIRNGSVRQTARLFDVPPSTMQGWVQKINEYFSTKRKPSSYKLKAGGRKSDSFEYDRILLDFIKEGREYGMAITSSEVINKAIEIIPGFKEKTYQALHHWFKRFRQRYSYSIRKVTKMAQTLPKNYSDYIESYLSLAVRDMVQKNTDINSYLVANVDETPLVLEPITATTLEKCGETSIRIKTFGKSKQKISCILCIFGNGKKAPPMIVFKGVPEGALEKKLNKIQEVCDKKVYVVCQQNGWADSDTFVRWLKSIWFVDYPFRKVEGSILYLDRVSSHLTDDVLSLFKKNNSFYRLIPPGLTGYCQPLDLSINKPFKDAIKKKYREFCIYWKNTRKPNPEHLIQWISEIWWSDGISEKTIQHSFKKGGINLKLDGSEDFMFKWPEEPGEPREEDLPYFKKEKKPKTPEVDYDALYEQDQLEQETKTNTFKSDATIGQKRKKKTKDVDFDFDFD